MDFRRVVEGLYINTEQRFTFLALALMVDAGRVGDLYVGVARCSLIGSSPELCQHRRRCNLLRWCASLGDSGKLFRNSVPSSVTPK